MAKIVTKDILNTEFTYLPMKPFSIKQLQDFSGWFPSTFTNLFLFGPLSR